MVADPDPNETALFWEARNPDPDPHYGKGWIRIRTKVKIREFHKLKIKTWGSMDAHRRGGSKWNPGGSVAHGRRVASL